MDRNEEQQLRDQEELAAMVAWAKHRIAIGGFDTQLKALFVQRINGITPEQMRLFSSQKTLVPFGVFPDDFMEQRADKMKLSTQERKGLHAPDFLDSEESSMIAWAMESIVTWLEHSPVDQVQFPHVLTRYREMLRNATQVYTLTSGHPPVATKVIDMVMSLARAKKYTK